MIFEDAAPTVVAVPTALFVNETVSVAVPLFPDVAIPLELLAVDVPPTRFMLFAIGLTAIASSPVTVSIGDPPPPPPEIEIMPA